MSRQILRSIKSVSWLAGASLRLALAVLVGFTATARGADPSTDAGRAEIVQRFFDAYAAATTNAAAVPSLLELLIPDGRDAAPCVAPHGVSSCGAEINVELTYAGAQGRLIPFAGTFLTQAGVKNALAAIRKTSITNSFKVKEILTSSFLVDFANSNPFTPQPYTQPEGFTAGGTGPSPSLEAYRAAALVKENRTVIAAGRQYRGDMVCLLTIESSGLISNIHFYYDSYVPSQVYAGDDDLIVNPDIDPVLTPLRNPASNVNPPIPAFPEPFSAVLAFFITFANPVVNVEGEFAQFLPAVITPNAIVSFAGDPKYLPFADNVIRQGAAEVIKTFKQQLANSRPRAFNLQEFFFPAATPVPGCEPCARARDRVVTNANELRFSSHTKRGYNPQVEILMTVREDRVASIQGIFDSVLTTTAFTGVDPFDCKYPQFNWIKGFRRCVELNRSDF